MKKKSVKFNTGNITEQERERDKSNEKSPDLKKSFKSRLTINSNNNDKLSNSVLEGLDKYEEKLKEINKNYQITNDKEDTQHMKYDSQFEISFHDDGRFGVNFYDDYTIFNNDIAHIKKINVSNDADFNINDIYNKNYLLNISKNNPNKKLDINISQKEKLNNIDNINELFLNKNKNDDNKQNGKLSFDKNEQDNNGSLSAEEEKKPTEINNAGKIKKKLTGGFIKRNKYIMDKNKKNSKEKIIPQKTDASTQTNKEEKCFKDIEFIRQTSFYILPKKLPNYKNINNEYFNETNYFSYQSNGNNTYIGNNQIEFNYNGNTYNPNTFNNSYVIYNNNNNNKTLGKKKINTLRYNQSYSNFSNTLNKDNKINKIIRKKNYYKNENENKNKNINIDPDILKINKTKNVKPQIQKKNILSKKIDIKNLKKLETFNQLQKFKSYYKKYEEMSNNTFAIEDPNYFISLSRKKGEFKNVKNIKDEVIVKRNEIIEKIEHCQNLLNTIMEEKKNFTNKRRNSDKNIDNLSDISNNTYSYVKRYQTNKSKKIINISNLDNLDNIDNIDNGENAHKEIQEIYIDNIKVPNVNNNYTYKKINIKKNDNKDKHSFDYKNKDIIMRAYKKKELDNSKSNNNNHSFDSQRKRVLYQNEDISPMVQKKLVGLYQKYENESYSPNININEDKLFNYLSLNNTFSQRNIGINKNQNNNKKVEDFTKNIYKNKNDDINNKVFQTRKIKGSKTKNQFFN